MIEFRPATPLSKGFVMLLDESIQDGHAMLKRLQDNWKSGQNQFSARGEIVIGAFLNGFLIGIGGRNIDPYGSTSRSGRIRHLYVARQHRRASIATMIVSQLIETAEPFFDELKVRAPPEAHPFYERLGFVRVSTDDFATHRLELKLPTVSP